MRIKIHHPTDWAAKTMLRRGLMTGGVVLVFVYFAPLKEIFCTSGGKICLALLSWATFLAVCAALFLMAAPVYILYKERARRRQKKPDITAVDFAKDGVFVYRPPQKPLFFPYKETSFTLTAQAAEKDAHYTRLYVVPAVQMTFKNTDSSADIPCRIHNQRRHLLPLLDMRQKFASFSLCVEPLQNLGKGGRKDADLPQVQAIRRKLDDYMQYGIWRSMSDDMRVTFELFGFLFTGAAVYFYFKLFGLSAPDWAGALILLLPAAGGIILLCAAAKDRKIQRRLERLRGKKSKKD